MLTLQQIILLKFNNKVPDYLPNAIVLQREHNLLKKLSEYLSYTELNKINITQCIL